jgi:hypothetical protein
MCQAHSEFLESFREDSNFRFSRKLSVNSCIKRREMINIYVCFGLFNPFVKLLWTMNFGVNLKLRKTKKKK